MKKWILLVSSIIISFVLFQNCGEMNSQSDGSSIALPSNSDIPEDDPDTIIFASGDALALDKIPFPLTANDQVRLADYMSQTQLKVLLFNQDGRPVFTYFYQPVDQVEARLKASERCELDQKRFCSLFAAGNTIVFSEKDFYSQFRSVLKQPNVQLNLSEIPGITSGKLTELGPYPDLNNTFTSLALGSGGSIHRGWSSDSQANADRRAREMCESLNNKPCALYASGMQVVFNIASYDWGPSLIDYAPAVLNLGRIPFVSDTLRSTTLNTAVNDARTGRPVVIALSRFGHVRVEVQAQNGPITQATRDRARQLCTDSIDRQPNATGYQHQCFIYSEGTQVVMTREDFEFYAQGKPRPL